MRKSDWLPDPFLNPFLMPMGYKTLVTSLKTSNLLTFSGRVVIGLVDSHDDLCPTHCPSPKGETWSATWFRAPKIQRSRPVFFLRGDATAEQRVSPHRGADASWLDSGAIHLSMGTTFPNIPLQCYMSSIVPSK